MAQRLKDQLTSSYFDAAHKLYPKKSRRKIVAYVESYEDVGFWSELLSDFETDEFFFQVMLPSASTLSKGKKMVLLNTFNTDDLGRSLIACVDSDYDFLLQNATATSRKINSNQYIFQTYAYAIENYHCFAQSLHNVVVQATLNDRHIIDFERYMIRYSEIVYPLFLWTIWFYRNHDTRSFPMYEFNLVAGLKGVQASNLYGALDTLERNVTKKLSELEHEHPNLKDQLNQLGQELAELGLTPQTTYLYIQGHHVKDNVVMKLLSPICAMLRRQREEEIERLAEHNEQYRNELTAYQNSQVNVDTMLRRNTGYRTLYLYQRLKQDLQKFIDNMRMES